MNRLTFVFTSLTAAAIVFACSDDEKKNTPTGDASAGGSGTGGSATGGASTGGAATGGTTGDASNDGSTGPTAYCTGQDPVTCGQYLVEHVDACADCHSPRLPNGQIDPTKILAGNAAFADFDPTTSGVGLLPTPNLTQLAASGWTVAEIQDAIQNGNRSAARGGGLFPIMPYMVFHNMADLDANAIAQYIHQLTPITNAIPTREPMPVPFNVPLPIAPVDATQIPNTTLAPTDTNYASAVRGKYLAAEAGICMECHTQRVTNSFGLDMTKAFGGGEAFQVGGPFGTVTSLNITPASNGAITGWTAQNIVDLLTTGTEPGGTPICPPMPAGPGQAFSGLTAGDKMDIANYIRSLPPVANPADGGRWPKCVPSFPSDSGVSDSGGLDASDSGG